jgi:TRAP-type C4-dicarboxylate transport system permease small subunit
MGQILFWQLLLLLVIAFLIVAIRDKNSYWWRLANKLERGLQPVFSAETTRSTEVEFIRDRLPERLPKWLIALATLVTLGALLWWWIES